MTDFINNLFGFTVPLWVYIASAAALVIIIIFLIWFVHTRMFKRRFKKIVNAKDEQQKEEAIKNFMKKYPANKLTRYSKRMERYSRQMGPHVVMQTGLADEWLQKLVSSKMPAVKDLKRVLLYCSPSCAFKAYLAAEKNPRLQKYFTEWMKTEGEDKVIRLFAETCRGEEFDASFAKKFLADNHETITDLTGEPEWFSRYFAYRTLLHDTESSAARSIEDGISDSHPLIRKILTENVSFEREKIWETVWNKLTCDPVFEVRKAARNRIKNEFMDLYNLKDKKFTDEETERLLELLDPACQEDKTFAFSSLDSGNMTLRYHASSFLDRCGFFTSLLEKNTLDDQSNIEHTVSVLKKALHVNVSRFLYNYQSADGAPLLIASRLLSDPSEKTGTQEQICYLENKVFSFFYNKKADPSTVEIYTNTLQAVSNNGNAKSFEILCDELNKRENDKSFMEMLLSLLPAQAGELICPVLFRFIKNVSFPLREELIKVLGSFNADIVLPEILETLSGNREGNPHIVRISALKILILLKLPFSLQRILESLPTLRPQEIQEFGLHIAEYPKDVFEEKVKKLLASGDAQIRASLINLLPIVKNDSFMKEIRSSLKDVDPDVRVAAVNALLSFGEIKLLNQETSMLHDPVERVRLATAKIIAVHGSAAAMDVLKNILINPNETDTVKKGVIGGLGQASGAEGIMILVSVLDSNDDLRSFAQDALSARTTKKDLTALINIFKDAEPPLREKLIPVFKAQGKNSEPQIVEILKEEVASLKPYLVQILEETGFIDEVKRKLSNRNVEVRREAAALLSLMDTLPAFRGLVIAAKDPDQEVRVCVVKALEKLKNSQSEEILKKLKEDPDNRIRKYTYWALERLDSLKME